MKACASSVTPERNFTEALAAVVHHPGFRQAALSGPHVFRDVSRLALSAFAATGNFFALHLVTGAHAYRLLYPFAGEHKDPIFALGVLGGFAAIGAPSFETVSEENKPVDATRFKSLLSRRWPDEHDVKIAYSAMRQAEFFADPAFTTAAVRYLESRGAV
jgi:hypothetical protein